MSNLFKGTSFNEDISQWDTSQVTKMNFMFNNCPEFNQDIGGWETGKVTDMRFMFLGCTQFNRDIHKWDTKQVTSMNGMFMDTPFDQDISGWNVDNVEPNPSIFNLCPIREEFKPPRLRGLNPPDIPKPIPELQPQVRVQLSDRYKSLVREWISIEAIVTKPYDYARIEEDPDDRCEKIPLTECSTDDACEVYKSDRRELCIRKGRKGTFRKGPPIRTKNGLQFTLIKANFLASDPSFYYQIVESEASNQKYVLFPTGRVNDVMGNESVQSFLTELAGQLIETQASYCICGHSMGCVLSLNLGLLIHQMSPAYFENQIVVLGSAPFRWLPASLAFKDMENVVVIVLCDQYVFDQVQNMMIDCFYLEGNAQYGHHLPYYIMYNKVDGGDKTHTSKDVYLHK